MVSAAAGLLDHLPEIGQRAQALAMMSDALGWRPWLIVGRLTSERDIIDGLRRDYGVEFSRPAIREALAILARDGFVEQIPQRGIRVVRASEEAVQASVDLLSHAMAQIAPAMAERQATDSLGDQLDRLDEHIATMDGSRSEGNLLDFWRAETMLHCDMARMAGYDRAAPWISVMRDEMRLLWVQGGVALPDGEMERVTDRNRDIVEAIGKGDAELAGERVRVYLDDCERRIGAFAARGVAVLPTRELHGANSLGAFAGSLNREAARPAGA